MTVRGFQVDLLTMHPPTQNSRLAPKEVRVLPFPPPLGYVLNAPIVKSILGRIQPDLVHAHYAGGYGTLARLIAFHPTMLSVWGSDVYVAPLESRWKNYLVRQNLEAADYLASTSEAMRQKTLELLGTNREVSVTPFGVDCDEFRPQQPIPGSPFTIGTVKTLEKIYGVDLLLRAFGRVVTQQPDRTIRLLIVGEGTERPALERLASELGVRQLTTFTGAVPPSRVPEYLHQMSVYVALSRSESFGVAVVEASACGVPVVVSNVGGLPEVVKDGVTGFIVPTEDYQAAADALLRLVNDPAQAESMRHAGRGFVSERFAITRTGDVMSTLYSKIIARSRRLVVSEI